MYVNGFIRRGVYVSRDLLCSTDSREMSCVLPLSHIYIYNLHRHLFSHKGIWSSKKRERSGSQSTTKLEPSIKSKLEEVLLSLLILLSLLSLLSVPILRLLSRLRDVTTTTSMSGCDETVRQGGTILEVNERTGHTKGGDVSIGHRRPTKYKYNPLSLRSSSLRRR